MLNTNPKNDKTECLKMRLAIYKIQVFNKK